MMRFLLVISLLIVVLAASIIEAAEDARTISISQGKSVTIKPCTSSYCCVGESMWASVANGGKPYGSEFECDDGMMPIGMTQGTLLDCKQESCTFKCPVECTVVSGIIMKPGIGEGSIASVTTSDALAARPRLHKMFGGGGIIVTAA